MQKSSNVRAHIPRVVQDDAHGNCDHYELPSQASPLSFTPASISFKIATIRASLKFCIRI
jgi:hypothetical protein